MSNTEAEHHSFLFTTDPEAVEDHDLVHPYRYDASNSSFDDLPEQSPSQAYWDTGIFRSIKLKQLKFPALFNTVLLIVVIVSSTAYFSSVQALLTRILSNQTTNHTTTNTAVTESHSSWRVDNVSSLVVFGDSLSAEVEMSYFIDHFEHHEKSEWKTRVNSDTAVGGFVWPRWTAWYTGAKVFNYAVGGAVCSSRITPHAGALGIQEHELVSFLADVAQSKDHIDPMIDTSPDSTVYAIFIGTNGLGNVGFLTEDQVSGKTLDDWIGCIFEAIDRIYQVGGRNFVIMNTVPLDRSPTFNSVDNGGVAKGAYWPNKPKDTKSVAIRMEQIVASVNYALKYQAAYEMQISTRYAGAKLAYFDVHKLFSDIIDDPNRFLNGTARPDTTGSCVSCNAGSCKTCASRDSYLWFDELHPSEQVSRIVAMEFQRIIEGSSSYAEYWHSSASLQS